MTSKRHARRKKCGSKRQYASQQEAVGALALGKKRGVLTGYMEPYRCKFCGWFHIGHA